MTSAKPQAMAAQTDAPDDLIAELARLMADDAKESKPPTGQPVAPVRIPGEPSVTPVPRFDFSATSGLAAASAPSSPVRIPGSDAVANPASAQRPAAEDKVEPFAFNFDLTPSAPANAPVTAQPVEEPAALDQDSLADLIAAELAADMQQDPEPQAQPDLPPPAPEPDSFGVPPVFGLGAPQVDEPVVEAPPVPAEPITDEPVAARRDPETPDPLDEIERLVGPAVRMNAANASPSPTPSLRSLATPVLPPEELDTEPPAPEPVAEALRPEPVVAVNSVDEAILAAAAATGAHVEWVNAGATEPVEPPAEIPEPTPARSGGFRINRAVAGPLVAVGLLGIAGLGLYWVLGQGGATTGPAPLLVADTTPTKEVPEAEAAAPTQSVVFNEISGADATAEEQLVSRDQADTEAVVAANTAVSSSGVIADTSSTSVDPNQDGLVNRKVRTVTVRPDGTIVSGEDSLAGSTILPVDRPNVPDVPGADFSTPDLIASAIADTATAGQTSAAATVVPAGPVAEPGSVIPVVNAEGTAIAGRSVTIPMQRPADFDALAASAIAAAASAATAPAAAAPVATPQPVAATTASGTAPAYVQLASQRSEADAQQTAQAVTTRYGVLFGGASPEIRRVDLGERGIYYRVLVPAASRENAANICANVKAAGGDCLLL